MKLPPIRRKTLMMIAVLLPLLLLFAWVGLRSGPLAPVPVVVATVAEEPVSPALFGIGTVQARFTYRVGPTLAGRVARVDVNVGDRVRAGQAVAAMEPVELTDRIRAQEATQQRAQAGLNEARARLDFARSQELRYQRLFAQRATTEEVYAAKRQEREVLETALAGAQQELARAGAERRAVVAQRSNLDLVAPVDGLVVERSAEPGSTVVAGQPVVEIVDPASLWVDTRFDQVSAAGLQAGLPARIVLRSRPTEALEGTVLRIEPRADAITEEMLAKAVSPELSKLLPPLGELAEVTIALGERPAAPVVPNAALQRIDGMLGVWRIGADGLEFAIVEPLARDLDGRVQVSGVAAGDRVVVYSEKVLSARSRIQVVDRLPGAGQ